MNDNTVLFSSLLLDACIVPVSVPVCHLDSRQQQQQQQQQLQQQQQQPSLMNNQQHQLQHQQNNPPHLAYQQANHHSYTTVTTSNQHGPTPIGAHQQGPVPPHLQQQVSPLLYPESFSLLLTCVLSTFFAAKLSQTCSTVLLSLAPPSQSPSHTALISSWISFLSSLSNPPSSVEEKPKEW